MQPCATFWPTTVVNFGHAVLIDCHSMPSSSQSTNPLRREPMRADFVLGDRFGNACAPAITHSAAKFLRELGYHVAINKPYAGGFITEHYGRPDNGLHALQIEINRALYMDEKRLTKNAGFDALASDLTSSFHGLFPFPKPAWLPPFRSPPSRPQERLWKEPPMKPEAIESLMHLLSAAAEAETMSRFRGSVKGSKQTAMGGLIRLRQPTRGLKQPFAGSYWTNSRITASLGEEHADHNPDAEYLLDHRSG